MRFCRDASLLLFGYNQYQLSGTWLALNSFLQIEIRVVKRVLLALLASSCPPALSDEADVLDVNVTCDSHSMCRFDVTVEHGDQGWEHFADRWEILSPDGEVLATRVLAHPHDHEQPFTRSLSKVSIDANLSHVIVRAHDSVHEYGGKEYIVDLHD